VTATKGFANLIADLPSMVGLSHSLLRRLRRLRTRGLAVLCAASVALTSVLPARAQPISLIRDTEVEELLKDYSRPIFRAAGLEAQNIDMRIVQSDSFNAFVMDGRNVFMHTEALMQSDTPNQIIGIIAHETGHIAGAHPATLRNDLKTAQSQQLLLLLLGIGMMVGGAMSGSSAGRELGGAGQGVMMGGESMVIRSFLLKRRSQEAAADQAGLEYLTTTKQSGRGMLETFERLGRSNLGSYGDPYMQSHPAEATRIRQLRDLVEKSPYANVRDTPELQLRHDLVRAKLFGFTRTNQDTFRQYPASNNSLPARYARAIARNCTSPSFCSANAMGDIDALLRERPESPYFWELKGQVLLTAGKAAEAVAPLRRSVEILKGKGPQVQIQLADAVFRSSEDPRSNDEVIQLIERAIITEKEDGNAYRILAEAYYRKKMVAEADLARAELSLLNANNSDAYRFAKRAQMQLKAGSPKWLRAEDIASTTKQKQQN
jgi:predicted Zn-dependent protease